MKTKVFLEYLASTLFLSGLVLAGGSLGLLTCNIIFGGGLYFAVMLAFGVFFTLSGKGLAWAVGGGEKEIDE